MPGIYSRDQFAQQLAQAIENANTRRQASLDREAARTRDNAAAIANFGKALGRWWETSGNLEDKLAKLQQEREEAIAAQKEEDTLLRAAKADLPSAPVVVVPNYADAMRRRSGVYAPRQDFDGVL